MPTGYEWVLYPIISGLLVATIIAVCRWVVPLACKRVCNKFSDLFRPAGGVVRLYEDAREVEQDLLAAIREAERALVFVGVSHRTHLGDPSRQSRFLAALDEAASRRVSIQFYFADPDGDSLRERAANVGLSDGCHWPDDIRSSWERLSAWKRCSRRRFNFNTCAYTAPPLLRYCLIDEKLVFVSYYHPWLDPDGVPPHKSEEPPIYRIERGRAEHDPLLDFFAHAHRLLGECRSIN
jgi:hypothetical protein